MGTNWRDMTQEQKERHKAATRRWKQRKCADPEYREKVKEKQREYRKRYKERRRAELDNGPGAGKAQKPKAKRQEPTKRRADLDAQIKAFCDSVHDSLLNGSFFRRHRRK